jgi:hypothetical protein
MTLLDQILAMILGALPPPHFSGRTTEEHYLFVSREHEEIRSDWKMEFGRLPSPTTATTTPTTTGSKTTAQEPEIDSEQAAWAEDSRLVAGMNGLQIENNSTAAPEIVPLAVDMRRALGIAENDGADDWDDVEDWDELLPDMHMNMSTATMLLPDHSNINSLPTMELPPTHTQPAMSSLRNPTIISSRPKKAGLRPGGKV